MLVTEYGRFTTTKLRTSVNNGDIKWIFHRSRVQFAKSTNDFIKTCLSSFDRVKHVQVITRTSI